MRGLLFLLAGISLSVLTACAGGGSSGSSSSDEEAFKVELTFSPTAEGFVIGNQSDFGDFVSLNITAISEDMSMIQERNISTAEFVDDSYDFTGLNNQSDWKFRITGTLRDGRQEPIVIVLVWEQNIADHESGGIRPGNNTDGDGRADSVDEDDDNDDIRDNEGDDCPTGETGWQSNPLTDNDMDGCRDAGEDDDDDNDRVLDLMDTGMVDGRECRLYEDCDDDGVDDDSDQCRDRETGWESNGSSDNDGDGCRDAGEDTDDDNDGLDDTDVREAQSNSAGMSCHLLADCDGDTIRDIDEAAVNCVIRADCDNDGLGDNEGDACPAGETSWTSNGDTDKDGDGCQDTSEDIDDDGDGLIEIGTAAALNSVRYALNGNGSRSAENAELDTTGCGGDDGISSCSGYELVADISLAAYRAGKGWQPLGHDTDSGANLCQGAAFNGTFEGNGWTIRDLNISRSSEDCVGLFGNIAADSEILNLTLHAETVIGRRIVGSLVGWGDSAQIFSSSVVVSEVKGSDTVGGLVGFGRFARIYSSSVVAGEMGTSGITGGLVGIGSSARIYSSWVVVGKVSGGGSGSFPFVGGLIGWGRNAMIYSSLVVVDELSGTASGGVGGLAGDFTSGKVAYSYVVSGSNTNMLIGSGDGEGIASYWDSETSSVPSGDIGDPKTTSDLRTPDDYEMIYASWDDNPVIFDDGSMIDEPLAVWCDKDHSGNITADEENPDNRIWDFGSSSQYPAIRCTPIGPD